MGEHDALKRVQEDLAAGRVAMARQRLRGLVGSYPQRLDLREQLADLYRRDGVLSQAGRWSFLREWLTPDEKRAFEREYSDPVHRMKALGWRGSEAAAGDVARERLETLRGEAERKVGKALSWERAAQLPRTPTTWGDRIFAVVLILVLALMVLGGIAFLIEGVNTVIEWLRR